MPLLLLYGAKVDQKNFQGLTPLLIAIALNRPEVVAILLKNHADANAKNL